VTAGARRAHAKLNVFLRVLGRRDDGYHEIETLIVPISLHDVVTVEPAEDLTVEVHGPAAEGVPSDDRNLALGAASALAAEAGGAVPIGARISIEKRIPVAAGLGGGSADAAATLLLLDELWGTSLDVDRLSRAALAVGSDVPALLLGEPAYARGRGDLVEPVLMQSTTWVVKPFDLRVSASDAYGWWDTAPVTGPDPGALIAAAEAGNDALLGSALFNDLQPQVVARHPEVEEALATFAGAGAHGAVMTGSGPTVVALCSFAVADRVAATMPGSIVVSDVASSRPPARIDRERPSGVV
jgi:4-diphosphocytidyl-2-C-methyl-D-erythritol kinase